MDAVREVEDLEPQAGQRDQLDQGRARDLGQIRVDLAQRLLVTGRVGVDNALADDTAVVDDSLADAVPAVGVFLADDALGADGEGRDVALQPTAATRPALLVTGNAGGGVEDRAQAIT